VISVQRGHDPREFALVPSAAPARCTPTRGRADGLLPGHRPALAGLLCALATSCRFRNEFAQTLIRPHREAPEIRHPDELEARRGVDGRARDRRADHGVFVADMRYHGQGYEIPWPLEETSTSASTRCTSSSTASACRTPASEIVNLRAVGPATGRSRSCPEAEPEPSELRAGTYAAADLRPGTSIPARRSSPSSTRPR
jgi:N-methylhydantoinase A